MVVVRRSEWKLNAFAHVTWIYVMRIKIGPTRRELHLARHIGHRVCSINRQALGGIQALKRSRLCIG